MARVFARVFPAQRAFVRKVIDEFGLAADAYQFGPFPKDKLTLQGDRLVQFLTPPHSQGLGTINWVRPNDDAIDGVAILEGPTPNLVMLNVRLPRELHNLAPVIIHDLLVRERRDAR